MAEAKAKAAGSQVVPDASYSSERQPSPERQAS
jgi:hypothetical protein